MSKTEPEIYLCRCCHSEGAYESLYSSFCWLDTEEIVYFKVLQDCFDIALAPVPQLLQSKLCGICETCAYRLQDAAQFKRQVQRCEQRFRDVYSSYICEVPQLLQSKLCGICETCAYRLQDAAQFKRQVQRCEQRFRDVYSSYICEEEPMQVMHSTVEVTIKQEVDADVKDVLPSFNGGSEELKIMKEDPFKDDDDDDDGFNDPDDDHDYKPPEDEKDAVKIIKDEAEESERKSRRIVNLAPEEVPSTKPKRERKTAANKVKKKRGRAPRVKKDPEAAGDEESLEYIDGISLIKVKHDPVRRNIDFKSTEEGFQCNRCPLVLKTDNRMRRHVQSVHFNPAKYKCPTCLEGFKSLGGLVKHKLELHKIDHRFKCNACDKMFFENQFLKDHTDTFHMLGEKRKCKVCDFETYSKVSFYKHKIKHLSVKNHQCKYCQKAFKRKTYLVLHERIHTGDKRKVCTECGEAYIDRTSLRYHMTRRHPEINF